MTTYQSVGELNSLRTHTGTGFTKPTKVTPIVDLFTNIAGTNTEDGSYGNTYMVQNLIPNTMYKLKFKVYRPNGSGGWTDQLGTNEFLRPSSVWNLPDTTTITSGIVNPKQFYWSHDGTNVALGPQELVFVTDTDDGSNITGSGFNNVRQTYNYDPVSSGGTIADDAQLYNVPPSNATYSGFTTKATSFSLQSTGLPPGGSYNTAAQVPSPDTFDAYLFLFNKPTAQSDYDTYYTNQVFTNTPAYIGAGSTGPSHYTATNKGFKVYAAINTNAGGSSSQTINIVPSDFAPDGIFGTFNNGQGLLQESEYVAGLMLVNRTSKYIVKTINGAVKWFTNVIPAGGVWSISLGEFFIASQVDTRMSDATSVVVKVDSIGVQGAVPTNFKLEIYAEPYNTA